jgi:hypothetical protein
MEVVEKTKVYVTPAKKQSIANSVYEAAGGI